ncbi:MAG: hypothetical protein HYU76_09700 [Betaproteobacteria bacterium]|nr:hypothetical protein [Betaproteobacteria bacterium]
MMQAARLFVCRARIALLAAALALSGCASTPQASRGRDAEAKQFLTHPNSATIYAYRNDFGSAESDDSVLYVDGRIIGATLPGTFFRVDVRPGVRVLNGTGYDQGSLRLETRSGELHFVELNVSSGQSRFRLVSADAGKREIVRCCALLENWAPGQRPFLR